MSSVATKKPFLADLNDSVQSWIGLTHERNNVESRAREMLLDSNISLPSY